MIFLLDSMGFMAMIWDIMGFHSDFVWNSSDLGWDFMRT